MSTLAPARTSAALARAASSGLPRSPPPLSSAPHLARRTPRPARTAAVPTRTGGPLSRDALEHRLAKHTATAAPNCPSPAAKTVTAHTLRHTAAMRLLHAGT